MNLLKIVYITVLLMVAPILAHGHMTHWQEGWHVVGTNDQRSLDRAFFVDLDGDGKPDVAKMVYFDHGILHVLKTFTMKEWREYEKKGYFTYPDSTVTD